MKRYRFITPFGEFIEVDQGETIKFPDGSELFFGDDASKFINHGIQLYDSKRGVEINFDELQ